MGIPFLTRLLYPYSQSVVLGHSPDLDRAKSIKSVVIDGPSLVYHISTRLLSQSDTGLNYPDVQPTCDEVSCGFIIFLLQLAAHGVKIEKICFDGALPDEKRDTRLARLEKSRRKLEVLRSKTARSFPVSGDSYKARTIQPDTIFRRRNLPARYSHVPESSFIVPAIFEDLKQRWCRKNIVSFTGGVQGIEMIPLDDFPWADMTVMVPGEADAYCAYLAKLTGSSVLTNDSDLLLHDLGAAGSVILLTSVEVETYDASQPELLHIRALKLCPALIAPRLGLKSLLPLAYELKNSPDKGMEQLLQQLKTTEKSPEEHPEYVLFTDEYRSNERLGWAAASWSYPQSLDPRISELYSQYGSCSGNSLSKSLNMYLVVLNEDPTRQCAWAKGQLYRNMAYSTLNVLHPINKRHTFVDEYVRRGGRIATDHMPLKEKEWILMQTRSLLGVLNMTRDAFGIERTSPVYWRMFALYVIYDGSTNTVPSSLSLIQFLSIGYMDKRPDWADIHLLAQIQSVLYSLRMLNQVFGIAGLTEDSVAQTRAALKHLPPLHILARPACEIIKELKVECSVNELVCRLMQLLGDNTHQDISICAPQCSDETAMQTQNYLPPVKHALRRSSNIFEHLSQQ
ncbi:hypothetical protein BO70DRAFT_391172 [Aspergillus heteromorphus CBS 117.55]|uniref:Asteroid domain-containing protein n=1 Tax=Aspergillus heteromorphus CBS 117.55 TaxID=1448321 RepID=A0A317UQB8_9EURO|nr:uncharacterized protein BO70DRAFT_391172 [Aspergillus heteromorphus CBS 117.55]PWY63559.1 hypothetical protein BO70DRAFT_391172 [Aspergillus heteromorphus CBS 117.55]